jgi:hypothetical protein
MRRETCIGAARKRNAIAELVRYIRELLDVIADEIIDEPSSTMVGTLAVLAQLRGRLESLEREITPTRH